MQEILNQYLAKVRQRPELTRVTATFSANNQQLLIEVDRSKAETLGVAVQDIYSTIQTMFGSLYVSQFNKFSRLWQVILQAEPGERLQPEDLDQIYVRSKSGAMVPLKAVTTAQYVTGPVICHALQQFSSCQDHRLRRTGIQLRPGDCRHGRCRRRGAAG